MEDSELIVTARTCALRAHRGQHCKSQSREPFVVHLAEVATYTSVAGGTPEQVALSWLHDIREDTKTTHEMIQRLFGRHMGVLVDCVTDPLEFKEMPVLERKREQARRIAKLVLKYPAIGLPKMGDQTSNVKRILLDPPLDMSRTVRRDYVLGAKLVYDVCGDNRFLDAEFYRVYKAAMAIYG